MSTGPLGPEMDQASLEEKNSMEDLENMLLCQVDLLFVVFFCDKIVENLGRPRSVQGFYWPKILGRTFHGFGQNP